MFSARINLTDLMEPPIRSENTILFGGSRLDLCVHPSVVGEFYATEHGYFIINSVSQNRHSSSESDFGFREVSASEILDCVRLTEDKSYDFVLIEICKAVPPTVKVRCGGRGILPVYFHADGNSIEFDWDYNRLVLRRKCVSLDVQVVAHRLCGKINYSPRTLVWDVSLLTERSTLTFSNDGLFHDLPVEAEKLQRLESIDSYVAEQAVRNLISDELITAGVTPKNAACELSGGIDSSVVATIASSIVGPGLSTLGLLVEPEATDDQRVRRGQLISSIRAKDYAERMVEPNADIFPAQIDLDEIFDFFIQGFNKLWSSASGHNASLILKGVGGDELEFAEASLGKPCSSASILTELSCEARRSQFLGLHPQGGVSPTAFVGLQHHAAPMFRHGLLQVAPLASPAVAAIFKVMPKIEALDRNVLRRIVASELHSGTFLTKYPKENFGLVVSNGVVRTDDAIHQIVSNSKLIDIGIVDPVRLHQILRQAIAQRNPTAMQRIAFFVNLERWLFNKSIRVWR